VPKATTSQRNQSAPASDCASVGLNHTTARRDRSRSVAEPPTYDASSAGQVEESCRWTVAESTATEWPETTVSRRPTKIVRAVCGRVHGTGRCELLGRVSCVLVSR
jgi:hypothetical protein